MSEGSNRLPADAPHGLGGSWIDRGRPVTFRLNGRVIEGFVGDTVLSAALASGISVAGRRGDEPIAFDERFSPPVIQAQRGAYPGALPMNRMPALNGLELNAVGTRRDPMASRGLLGRLRHLMVGPDRTLNQRYADTPPPAPAWQQAEPAETLTTDTLVVGGGVSGMSAAMAAIAAGDTVILVERDQALGGAARFFGSVDNEEAPETTIKRLTATTRGSDKATVLTRTEAFAIHGTSILAHQVQVEGDRISGRVVSIAAKRVILATGAFERLQVFPGNRSPGVVGALTAFQRAERYGLWLGKRALFNTPHSATYRLALHAADAGIEVQRIIDARVGPTSRFLDFCKASGITLASGLIPSHAVPAKRDKNGLIVGFSVAIDNITQDSSAIETDQLVAAGGWQPDLALWLMAGGGSAWDAVNCWLAPRGALESVALAGAAAGFRGNSAAIVSGKAAVLGMLGRRAPVVEDKLIEAIYETPDATTPISPYREGIKHAAFLDGGPSFPTRRAAAANRLGVPQLAGEARALSVGDIAAAVEVGAIPAIDAGAVAAERCLVGGDIADGGWRLALPAPTGGIPVMPAYLNARFGPKRQLCVIAVDDTRFFEPGCLVYLRSDLSDPRKAIGVIVGNAPGGRSGGLALMETVPEALDARLFVRDSSGAVPVRVMERLKAAKA